MIYVLDDIKITFLIKKKRHDILRPQLLGPNSSLPYRITSHHMVRYYPICDLPDITPHLYESKKINGYRFLTIKSIIFTVRKINGKLHMRLEAFWIYFCMNSSDNQQMANIITRFFMHVRNGFKLEISHFSFESDLNKCKTSCLIIL